MKLKLSDKAIKRIAQMNDEIDDVERMYEDILIEDIMFGSVGEDWTFPFSDLIKWIRESVKKAGGNREMAHSLFKMFIYMMEDYPYLDEMFEELPE